MRLAELLVSVGLEAKGLQRMNQQLGETERSFRRSFGNIQKRLQSFGKTATVAITAPLVAAAYKSVEAFDKQAKAVAQVEQGLKSTGNTVGFTSQQLQKMASDLQQKTIFGDEEILQGATAQLLTFTNITGQQFARTQVAAMDLATRLDGDLKSASIQLGKALNDPIANLSALSRSGIQFSAEQKETIAALVETNQLAKAQTVILDELEKQYGGSAEAAAEAGTGGLKQLQNQLGDLSEEFGKILVEMLPPLIEKVKEITAYFQGLSPEVKETIVKVAALAAALGPLVMVLSSLSGLLPLIGAMSLPFIATAAAVAVFIGGVTSLAMKIHKARNESAEMEKTQRKLAKAFENSQKAAADYYKTVDRTATIEEKLADLTLANVESALGRVDGQVRNMTVTLGKSIGQNDLDRIQELEKYYQNVETFGLTPLEAALQDYRAELKKTAKAEADAAGKGESKGRRRGKDMAPIKSRGAQQIENIGATATATLQPLLDVTGMWEDQTWLEGAQAYNDRMDAIKDSALELAHVLGTQLGGALQAIIAGTVKGKDAFKAFARDAIKAALSASQAHIIEAAIASGKMTGPAAMFVIPALIAAGMGIVDAAFGDVAAFAAGGLVAGPVLGMVGEGRGTSFANPEVIAPLDKLQNMLGGQPVTVTGRLDGRDIVISSERANFDRNRIRGF